MVRITLPDLPSKRLVNTVLTWLSGLLLSTAAMAAPSHPAINAFTTWCFIAGQTEAQAHANMRTNGAAFDLIFWDKTLEPAPSTPAHVERRCEVSFDGDHRDSAVKDVQAKMAAPPVFGTSIPLTAPYEATDGTAYIDARALLRGRGAVVHIGLKDQRTFIRVDRLPAGMGLGT